MSKKYSLAGVLVMAMAVVAWACPPEDESSTAKKDGGCQGKAQTVAGKEGCCKKAALMASASGCCKGGKTAALVAEVMKSLPHLTYKVGDKETPCPDAAAALAAETEGAKITYLVGDKSFDTKNEAQVRLASLLDAATNDLLTVGYSVDGECVRCPMHAQQTADSKKSTVKYRVAGVDFASREQAEKAIAKAREALTGVTVTKKVGDKEESVKSLDDAKCSDKATYTVAGEQTECPIQAKLLLANAKIRVIVETALSSAS